MLKKMLLVFSVFLVVNQNIILANQEEQNKPEKTISQYIDDVDEMLADSYGYYVVEIKRGDRTYRIPYVTRKQRRFENILIGSYLAFCGCVFAALLNMPYQGSYAQQSINWTRDSFDSLLRYIRQ